MLKEVAKADRFDTWRTRFMGATLVLLGILFLVVLAARNPLMDETGSTLYYNPESGAGKGYVGKVNQMLDRALNEKGSPRLEVRWDELREHGRLLRFTPASEADSLLAYNTFFWKDLRRDSLLPEGHPAPRFILYGKRGADVDSIRVDPLSRRVRLSQKVWKGTLRSSVSMDDYLFIEHLGEQFPLPAFRDQGAASYHGNVQSINLRYSNASFDQFLAEFLSARTGSVRISPDPTREEEYLEVMNYGPIAKLKFVDQLPEKRFRCDAYWGGWLSQGNQIEALRPGRDYPRQKSTFMLMFTIDGERIPVRIDTVSTYATLSYAHQLESGFKRIRSLLKGETDRFTEQVMDVLPTVLGDVTDTIPEVLLALDPYQGVHFQRLLRKHALNMADGGDVEIGLVLMDPRNGDVIAAPYFSSEAEKDSLKEPHNINFDPKPVGSTFKPIWLSACFLSNPALHRFAMSCGSDYSTSPVSWFKSGEGVEPHAVSLLGYSMPAFDAGTDRTSDWKQLHLESAIGFSSNIYPVAVGLLALASPCGMALHEGRVYRELSATDVDWMAINRLGLCLQEKCHTVHLTRSSDTYSLHSFSSSLPARALEQVYGLLPDSDRSVGWRGLQLRDRSASGRLNFISPEPTDLKLDNMDERISSATMRQNFVSFILGDHNTRLNNVKLAECYSRLLTKHNVAYSFIAGQRADSLLVQEWVVKLRSDTVLGRFTRDLPICSVEEQERAWNSLIGSLRMPTSNLQGSTASRAGLRIAEISGELFGDAGWLQVLGKTGTPDFQLGAKNDESRGLFAFYIVDRPVLDTLLSTSSTGALPSNCGVVGVISISRDGKVVKNKNQEITGKDAVKLFEALALDIYLMNRKRFTAH